MGYFGIRKLKDWDDLATFLEEEMERYKNDN